MCTSMYLYTWVSSLSHTHVFSVTYLRLVSDNSIRGLDIVKHSRVAGLTILPLIFLKLLGHREWVGDIANRTIPLDLGLLDPFASIKLWPSGWSKKYNVDLLFRKWTSIQHYFTGYNYYCVLAHMNAHKKIASVHCLAHIANHMTS